MIIYGDQTAFVKCSEGFKILGNSFIFCLRTSQWEISKMPTCKIVKCDPLRTPSNGRMALTKTTFNGRATFSCDEGFILIGNETLTCMANGNWSDSIPLCKSIYECPALKDPANGFLTYASDSGVIDGELESYPLGTFVEIKCDSGFFIEGENLISCVPDGVWDFEVEDCQLDATSSTTQPEVKIPMDFWRDLKEFLFYSCEPKKLLGSPKLCNSSTPDFTSDLSLFELPETPEYERMDSKLLKILSDLLTSKDFDSLSVENFMTNLEIADSMRESYRFVICLYIDLILMDDDLNDPTAEMNNINENIKITLRKIAQPIYQNYLTTII